MKSEDGSVELKPFDEKLAEEDMKPEIKKKRAKTEEGLF